MPAAGDGHSGRRIVANPARADLRRARPQYDLPPALAILAVGGFLAWDMYGSGPTPSERLRSCAQGVGYPCSTGEGATLMVTLTP